jgi:hypothetical protein
MGTFKLTRRRSLIILVTTSRVNSFKVMGQYYKTFYGRNLQIYVISYGVCLWQSSLMFVGEARSLPIEWST